MRGKTNLLRWPVFVLFLLVALCTSATGEVIHVDDDAAGANSGASWEDAFTDLQDALALAQEGDEIRVAQGIYTPSQDPLDREATFQLKDGVSIIGGYAGRAGMYPDFRHIKAFATILSGDIDHNDFGSDPNNKLGNSLHVVMCTGPSNAAVLKGVTITGGYATRDVPSHSNGSDFRGGGLHCQRGCSPRLIDCVFIDNYAISGGAVLLVSTYSSFVENEASERSWRPVFIRCTFADNHAWSGGAVYNGRRWHAEFISCLFENNDVERSGGGITSYRLSTLTLNHCVFRGNAAGRRGGAIRADLRTELQLINCLFVANTAGDTGGAISCPDVGNGSGDSILNVLNCTFYGNSSPTFYKPPRNSLKQPDGSFVVWSGSVITNCIFSNSIVNEVSKIPVSFEFWSREPLIITSIYEKEPGQGGIIPPMPDRLFVDPYGADSILGTEDDDFRLAPGSPAIDAGTNDTEPPLPAMDLDGYPRILNDTVDMGAYESTGVFNTDDDDAPGS